ncbi:unnamed protein product [Brassicogethes aeneus]|uniref:Uncharacterized protein n=1 Tax=Brassicogethes aeneus TaxID=1431903 RepID=A0A9P0FCG4_BRAAE|nr:unnamed protein product [Brassicogethes aeneus]
MLVKVGVVGLFVIFGLSDANLLQGNSPRDLQMVHIVMRHGIRTPENTYPNDPHINNTLYPVGWGQLTNAGKLLQYDTGKFLRKRYNDFLGENYWPEQYYCQSTNVDRTKASVELTNAGLWPPSKIQQWGPLDWQPIPVTSLPLEEDNLLHYMVPCEEYERELEKVVKSEEVQKIYRDNEKLIKKLQDLTGKDIKTLADVQDVYSTLQSEKAFNLTLPTWADYFMYKMQYLSDLSFSITSYNDKLRRLKGGPLLKKILNDWKAKKNGTIKPMKRKAFLYGAHDYTIAYLLGALKIFDPQTPGYGVAVLLELSKNQENEFAVQVFFRNDTSLPPYELTIPGCTKICPLEKLVDLTKNVIPGDVKAECKSEDRKYVTNEGGETFKNVTKHNIQVDVKTESKSDKTNYFL